MLKRLLVVAVIASLPMLAGCSNAQEKGTAGAVLGGIAGGVIGHQSDERNAGIAIGAASGAALGYIIGNEQDKEEIRNEKNQKGHWEYSEQKVWVPGYTEKRWVAPVYENKYDANGESYRVLVEDGHYEYVNHDGYWEVQKTKVWVKE